MNSGSEPSRKRRRIPSIQLWNLIQDNECDGEIITRFHELIEDGADVNYQNPEEEEENTPLLLAIIKNSPQWVQFLLENDAKTEIKNATGKTPADLALETGNKEILRLLNRKFKIIDKKFVHEIEFAEYESSCGDVFVSRIKVLSITKCPTLQQAFHLVAQPDFCEKFNQMPFLFIIVLYIEQDRIDFCVIDKYLERLKGKFSKELILQFSSRDSSEIYFKEKSDKFKRLAISDAIPENILSDQLYNANFQQICNLLHFRHERFGHFESNVFKIKVSTEESINEFRLIDYAVMYEDVLTLRFLQLFRIDLGYVNDRGSRVLETAAEFGNLDAFKILLEIPEHDENLQSLLSPENLKVLNFKKQDSNLLMLAAQEGHFDVVRFLIDCGLNVNQVNQQSQTISDFAWEALEFGVLLKTIKADGPFPENVDLQVHPGLQALVKERNAFHQYLRDNNSDDPSLNPAIRRFLRRNSNLRICYNSENRCALSSAMEARQFKVYALLRSKGFRRGLDKDNSIYMSMGAWERKELAHANQMFFKTNGFKHIMELVSRSRVGIDSDDYKIQTIQRWYEKLDETEMLQTIMKVVANAEEVDIVFDFEKETICDLDFTGDTSETFGRTYHKLDVIFIGAKRNPEEVLATIAHEFTHYALKLVYKNNCRPYYPNDIERSESFKGILNQYLDKIKNDQNYWRTINPVIQIALGYDQMSHGQICELIVRPPHLIALHFDNPTVLEGIRIANLRLFHYFDHVVIPAFEKKLPVMKAQQKVQELNRDILRVFSEFDSSNITCKNFDFSFEGIGSESRNIFIQSKVPGLCLSNLIRTLKKIRGEDVDASNIFIRFDQLVDSKLTTKVQEAFHSENKPRLIVISENPVHLQIVEDAFICFKANLVFIANLDLSSHKDIFSVQLPDQNYKWADLTLDSKKRILSQKISLQDEEIELCQIIETHDEILSQLSLEEILKLHELNIKPLEKFDPLEYIERTFEDSEKTAITPEEVCELIKNGTSVLVANDAGVGKTMSAMNFSRELKKKSPSFWVSYIDLKSYTDFFFKDKEPMAAGNIDHSYLSENLLKLEGNRERKIFEHLYKTNRSVFVFDGFDEISPNYKTFVLQIFKAVQSSGNQMLISTRVHLTIDIKEEIRVEVIKLKPLTKQNQIDLLVKFWEKKYPNRKDLENIAKSLLSAYKKYFILGYTNYLRDYPLSYYAYDDVEDDADDDDDDFDDFVDYDDYDEYADDNFLGTPLQVRMLAEIHEGLNQSVIENIEKNFNLFSLYNQFVKKKLMIWKVEKGPLAADDSVEMEMNELSIIRMHQRAALEYFLDKETVNYYDKLLEYPELDVDLKELINRTGMLQMSDDLSFNFVHQTFAEYFFADFMFWSKNAPIELYENVLLDNRFVQVRKFINDKIKVDQKGIANFSPKIINMLESKESGLMFFMLLIEEKHLNLIEFIFSELNLDKKSKFELLTKEFVSCNAIHYAAEINDHDIFNTLWEYVKVFCNVEEQKQMLEIEGSDLLTCVLQNQIPSLEMIEAVLKIEFELMTSKEVFMSIDWYIFYDLNTNRSARVSIFKTVWKFFSKLSEEEQKEILMAKIEINLSCASYCKDREIVELILNEYKNISVEIVICPETGNYISFEDTMEIEEDGGLLLE